MGKRKRSSRKPQGTKKADPLPSTFACLFCNHENAVAVRVDRKKDLGILECKVCGQSFQTSISYLTLPVDVYADWVDACEAVARPRPSRVPASPSMPAMAREAEGMSTEVDIRMSIEDHDEALSMI